MSNSGSAFNTPFGEVEAAFIADKVFPEQDAPEQEVTPELAPFMERIKLPLTGEMSHKRERRFARAMKNGGNVSNIAKRNQVSRGRA